ncbi:MAG TPA: type II toxin-antitoxin system VapB family antitoxin [Xanthobacteraceae bacterium]|nr:type II toxin-antitoxin system VapB family antitoxin [Xanthobacteraceae bacterium]
MALFVKDPEVSRLAEQLATLKKMSKTEAVRQALRHELQREKAKPDLAAVSVAFCRALRARGNPAGGLPADKEFIDSLYE